MSDHAIVHVEISAKDPSDAARFYVDLFGWKHEAQPEFDYVTFEAGSGPGGGFARIDGESYKAGDVVVYIETDDIQASLVKVESLGGKTLLPKTEIPGVGWFAFFSDPSGNRLGLFTGSQETS